MGTPTTDEARRSQHGPSPYLDLNNGVKLPALGLGVFLSPPEQTADAVETAIHNGYRLIDTAAAYNNERQVGEGIRRSGIGRADIFVTTKLWVADYGHDAALRAFDASLRRLGVDYIDLYLLHWPVPSDFDATVAAYKAAETLLAEGRARAIGACNFSPQHLENLLRQTDVVPAVNQVELHPYFTQRDVRDTNARHAVLTQSWSPIGGVYDRNQQLRDVTKPLENPVIVDLATKHGKTAAQIILRWHLAHGFSAIPKSVTASRIAETSTSSTSRSNPKRSPPSTPSTPGYAPAPTRRSSTPTRSQSPLTNEETASYGDAADSERHPE